MVLTTSLALPFTLPIPDYESAGGPQGYFKLSSVNHDSSSVYLLSFFSPPDNRLTSGFLETFCKMLDIVEKNVSKNSVLFTTSEVPKFYSNGFDVRDLASAAEVLRPKQMEFAELGRKMLTFPIPTVALVNGHTFAGGVMLIMCHDYRIMNASKGWICMNEVDMQTDLPVGTLLTPAIVASLTSKLSPKVCHDILIGGRRFTGPEALEAKIVDGLGGIEEALRIVDAYKLFGKGANGLFAQLKAALYANVLEHLPSTMPSDGEKNGRETLVKLPSKL